MPLAFHKARGTSGHIESKIDIGLAGRKISRKSMFRFIKAGKGAVKGTSKPQSAVSYTHLRAHET